MELVTWGTVNLNGDFLHTVLTFLAYSANKLRWEGQEIPNLNLQLSSHLQV